MVQPADTGADLCKELEAHQTFESWTREGEELSRRVVYLNGELRVAVGQGGRGRRLAA
jgi:hypothetical protein